MSLPVMTLPEDVEQIVSYLRSKATGAKVGDVKAALGGKLVDGRKLSGYESWGFISRDGDTLKLENRGRKLDRANSEPRKVEIYREVIEDVPAYRMAAEWMHYQDLEEVPVADLGAHWNEHIPEQIDTESEKGLRGRVTCFFNLAEAAGLGIYKRGRGGRPTRLEVNQDELGQFIAEMSLEPGGAVEEVGEGETDEVDEEEPVPEAEEEAVKEPRPSLPPEMLDFEEGGEAVVSRVFIAHGKNKKIRDQVESILEPYGLECEVAEKEETPAIPVSEKVFNAMRKCQAGVICVTADEGEADNENYTINQNVLIEIGAAFVLYEKRVILVWDRRLEVPSNLQGLYRCEFEGDELSWESGMKLVNAVGKFKKDEPLSTDS